MKKTSERPNEKAVPADLDVEAPQLAAFWRSATYMSSDELDELTIEG